MNVVTSFSPLGWKVYGKRFVDTFLKHWPHHVRLDVFLEGQEVPASYEAAAQWHDLKDDPEHEEFCAKYAGPEFNDPRDFNAESVRFCHKVYAVTSPQLPIGGWRVWIDSDVIFTADVTEDLMAQVFPFDKALTFLGRKPDQWIVNKTARPICTETGWVGYNLLMDGTRELLADMRRWYNAGELFTRPRTDWHDAKCFDVCRERSSIPEDRQHSYSANVDGTDVWPQTILSRFSSHQKGPRRKLAAYGAYA